MKNLDVVGLEQRLLEIRIAVDVLEDLMVEELDVVLSLINLGDYDGAKNKLMDMKSSIEKELPKNETSN